MVQRENCKLQMIQKTGICVLGCCAAAVQQLVVKAVLHDLVVVEAVFVPRLSPNSVLCLHATRGGRVKLATLMAPESNYNHEEKV